MSRGAHTHQTGVGPYRQAAVQVPRLRRTRRGLLLLLFALSVCAASLSRRVTASRAAPRGAPVHSPRAERPDAPPRPLREVVRFGVWNGGFAVTRRGELYRWTNFPRGVRLPPSAWHRAWRVPVPAPVVGLQSHDQSDCRGTEHGWTSVITTVGATQAIGHHEPFDPAAMQPLRSIGGPRAASAWIGESASDHDVSIARDPGGWISVHSLCERVREPEPGQAPPPAPTPSRFVDAVAVRAGSNFACVLTAGGEVHCWSFQTYVGYAEDDLWRERRGPFRVSVPPLRSLLLLRDRGCGITRDGGVYCFASSAVTDSWRAWSHPWLRGVTQLHALAGDLCATHHDGTVDCDTSFFSLPAWARPTPEPPTRVEHPGLRGAVEIAGHLGEGCARFADGTLRCWGERDLPDGRVLFSTTPLRGAGEGFVEIAAGRAHACGRTHDGRVSCWGGAVHRRPTWIDGVRDVAQIAAGARHTCARTRTGEVYCWGEEPPYAFGAARTAFATEAPTRVPALAGVVEITAGTDHACARLADGAVRCWGEFGGAWPGSPRVHGAVRPLAIALDAPAVGLRSAGAYACATLPDRRVRCWGGSRAPSEERGDTLPQALIDASPASTATLVPSSTASLDCEVTRARVLRCGVIPETRFATEAPLATAPFADVTLAASSDAHACVLRGDREVRCIVRRTPRNDEPAMPPLADVTLPRPVRGLTVGHGFACALLVDGTPWCWGENRDGQLGTATPGRVSIDAPTWIVE